MKKEKEILRPLTVDEVEEYAEKFGYSKANLERGPEIKQGNGEGVWVAAMSKKDRKKLDDDTSEDELVTVLLANDPFGPWAIEYGEKMVVRTRGKFRPVALVADQRK